MSTEATARRFGRAGPRLYITVQIPPERKLRRVRVYLGQDGRYYRVRTHRLKTKSRKRYPGIKDTKQVLEYTHEGKPLAEMIAADLLSAHARAMTMRNERIDAPCLCGNGHETSPAKAPAVVGKEWVCDVCEKDHSISLGEQVQFCAACDWAICNPCLSGQGIVQRLTKKWGKAIKLDENAVREASDGAAGDSAISLTSIGVYTCKDKDRAVSIASKLGCHVRELVRLNKNKYPDLTRMARLHPHTRLLVPMTATCAKDGSVFDPTDDGSDLNIDQDGSNDDGANSGRNGKAGTDADGGAGKTDGIAPSSSSNVAPFRRGFKSCPSCHLMQAGARKTCSSCSYVFMGKKEKTREKTGKKPSSAMSADSEFESRSESESAAAESESESGTGSEESTLESDSGSESESRSEESESESNDGSDSGGGGGGGSSSSSESSSSSSGGGSSSSSGSGTNSTSESDSSESSSDDDDYHTSELAKHHRRRRSRKSGGRGTASGDSGKAAYMRMVNSKKWERKVQSMQRSIQDARIRARDARRRRLGHTITPPRLSISTRTLPAVHRDSSPESILELFRERYMRLAVESRQATAAAVTTASTAAAACEANERENIVLRQKDIRDLTEELARVTGKEPEPGSWLSDPGALRRMIDDAQSLSGLHAATYFERSVEWATVTPETARPPWRLVVGIRPPSLFWTKDFGEEHCFPVTVELRDAVGRLVKTREPIRLKVDAVYEKDDAASSGAEQEKASGPIMYWNRHDVVASSYWESHKARRAVRQGQAVEKFLKKSQLQTEKDARERKKSEEERAAMAYASFAPRGGNPNTNVKSPRIFGGDVDVGQLLQIPKREALPYPNPIVDRMEKGVPVLLSTPSSSSSSSSVSPASSSTSSSSTSPSVCRSPQDYHTAYVVGGIASWRMRFTQRVLSPDSPRRRKRLQLKITPCLGQFYFNPKTDEDIANLVTGGFPKDYEMRTDSSMVGAETSSATPEKLNPSSILTRSLSYSSDIRIHSHHDGLATELAERRHICSCLNGRVSLLTRPIRVCDNRVPEAQLVLFDSYMQLGGAEESYVHPVDGPENAHMFVEYLHKKLESILENELSKVQFSRKDLESGRGKSFSIRLDGRDLYLSKEQRNDLQSRVIQIMPTGVVVDLRSPESAVHETLRLMKAAALNIVETHPDRLQQRQYIPLRVSSHENLSSRPDLVPLVPEGRIVLQTQTAHFFEEAVQAARDTSEAAARAAELANLAEKQYRECLAILKSGRDDVQHRLHAYFVEVSTADRREREANSRMDKNLTDAVTNTKRSDITEADRQINSTFSLENAVAQTREFQRSFRPTTYGGPQAGGSWSAGAQKFIGTSAHQCGLCHRYFANGNALGGHKKYCGKAKYYAVYQQQEGDAGTSRQSAARDAYHDVITSGSFNSKTAESSLDAKRLGQDSSFSSSSASQQGIPSLQRSSAASVLKADNISAQNGVGSSSVSGPGQTFVAHSQRDALYVSRFNTKLNLNGTDIVAHLAGGTFTNSEGDHDFETYDRIPEGCKNDLFASATNYCYAHQEINDNAGEPAANDTISKLSGKMLRHETKSRTLARIKTLTPLERFMRFGREPYKKKYSTLVKSEISKLMRKEWRNTLTHERKQGWATVSIDALKKAADDRARKLKKADEITSRSRVKRTRVKPTSGAEAAQRNDEESPSDRSGAKIDYDRSMDYRDDPYSGYCGNGWDEHGCCMTQHDFKRRTVNMSRCIPPIRLCFARNTPWVYFSRNTKRSRGFVVDFVVLDAKDRRVVDAECWLTFKLLLEANKEDSTRQRLQDAKNEGASSRASSLLNQDYDDKHNDKCKTPDRSRATVPFKLSSNVAGTSSTGASASDGVCEPALISVIDGSHLQNGFATTKFRVAYETKDVSEQRRYIIKVVTHKHEPRDGQESLDDDANEEVVSISKDSASRQEQALDDVPRGEVGRTALAASIRASISQSRLTRRLFVQAVNESGPVLLTEHELDLFLDQSSILSESVMRKCQEALVTLVPPDAEKIEDVGESAKLVEEVENDREDEPAKKRRKLQKPIQDVGSRTKDPQSTSSKRVKRTPPPYVVLERDIRSKLAQHGWTQNVFLENARRAGEVKLHARDLKKILDKRHKTNESLIKKGREALEAVNDIPVPKTPEIKEIKLDRPSGKTNSDSSKIVVSEVKATRDEHAALVASIRARITHSGMTQKKFVQIVNDSGKLKMRPYDLKKIIDLRYVQSAALVQKGREALAIVDDFFGDTVENPTTREDTLVKASNFARSSSKSSQSMAEDTTAGEAVSSTPLSPPSSKEFVSSRGRVRKPKVLGGYAYEPVKIMDRSKIKMSVSSRKSRGASKRSRKTFASTTSSASSSDSSPVASSKAMTVSFPKKLVLFTRPFKCERYLRPSRRAELAVLATKKRQQDVGGSDAQTPPDMDDTRPDEEVQVEAESVEAKSVEAKSVEAESIESKSLLPRNSSDAGLLDEVQTVYDLLQMKSDELGEGLGSRSNGLSKHRDLTNPILVTPQDEALRVIDGGPGVSLAKQWLALGVKPKAGRDDSLKGCDLQPGISVEDCRSLCSQAEIVNAFVLAPEAIQGYPSRQQSTLEDVVTFVPLPVSGNSNSAHGCRQVLKEVVQNRLCYPPPVHFRRVNVRTSNSTDSNSADIQAAETRKIHAQNMHKRWYATIDGTNVIKADQNTKIALAASRHMRVPMVKYSGDIVVTGSLAAGFTVRGPSRSACLYELRRQILYEFDCEREIVTMTQTKHGQNQKKNQSQDSPGDGNTGGILSSVTDSTNDDVVHTSVNIDTFLQKRKRSEQHPKSVESPKTKKRTFENLKKSTAINLDAWKAAQEYDFLLQNNNPGLLVVHSQGHPTRVYGSSARGPEAQDAMYLIPRTSTYHPGQCNCLEMANRSLTCSLSTLGNVRMIWDPNTTEVLVPENHPLVVISHLFAEAFDANGIICGRFEMKITKRLARNSSTGVLEYPLRAIGMYMLVELRERTTSNTTAGGAAMKVVSDVSARIAEASRMMTGRGGAQIDSEVARSAKIAIASRLRNAARQASLKNLIGKEFF